MNRQSLPGLKYSLKTLLMALALSAIVIWISTGLYGRVRTFVAVRGLLNKGGTALIKADATTPRSDDFMIVTENDTNALLLSIQSIEHIDFTGVKTVQDSDLSQLRDLPNLKLLSLGYSRIGDKSLEIVGQCHNLVSLGIEGTSVTDSGVAALLSLEKLVELDLENTDVSDSAIETLLRMQQLKFLYVSGTQMTDEGVTALRRGLPNCVIEHRY